MSFQTCRNETKTYKICGQKSKMHENKWNFIANISNCIYNERRGNLGGVITSEAAHVAYAISYSWRENLRSGKELPVPGRVGRNARGPRSRLGPVWSVGGATCPSISLNHQQSPACGDCSAA